MTRKYQVTIPEKVRSELGVKIGDKLIVKSENNRIVMEAPERISNPSDVLWNLFGKTINVNAVTLVEESWKETRPSEPRKSRAKKRKANTD